MNPNRHRSFQVAIDPEAAPVTFDLSGGPPLSAEPWAESFTCLQVMPAAALDDLTSSVSMRHDGAVAFNGVSIVRFVRQCLVADDQERFDKLIHDPRRVVDIMTLYELTTYLQGELTGFPTTPPSGSMPGRQNGGPTSTATSPSPAPTRFPLEQPGS